MMDIPSATIWLAVIFAAIGASLFRIDSWLKLPVCVVLLATALVGFGAAYLPFMMAPPSVANSNFAGFGEGLGFFATLPTAVGYGLGWGVSISTKERS